MSLLSYVLYKESLQILGSCVGLGGLSSVPFVLGEVPTIFLINSIKYILRIILRFLCILYELLNINGNHSKLLFYLFLTLILSRLNFGLKD